MQYLRRLSVALSSVTRAPVALARLALAMSMAPLMAFPAAAQTPHNWELGMQAAHSPVKEQIASLHDLVLVIITVITVFVAALLGYAVWRFDHRRNPVASRTSHNTVIEIAWTVIPVLILVVIAIPSFRLV